MSQSLAELEVLALEAAAGPQPGLTPTELHGIAIGIGVTDPERFELQDLVELAGADALSDAETVARFVEAAMTALCSEDLSFSPLLPDEDEPMNVRLEGLAGWCQSFLTGLAAGMHRRGIEALGELPDEANEIVQDFVAIAQLDTEAGEAQSEADFMELEEYVKVGALLIMSLMEDGSEHIEE